MRATFQPANLPTVSVRGSLSPSLQRWAWGLIAAGAAVFLAGLALDAPAAWGGLLLAGFYLLSLGLGAIFLLAIQGVSGGRWSMAYKIVPETLSRLVPWGLLLVALALLLGLGRLYHWSHEEIGRPIEGFRHAWFGRAFFYGRFVVYAACWLGIGGALVRVWRQRPGRSDLAHTPAQVRLSALFLVTFGLSFTYASIDWLMSLDHHWFSAVFALYSFAGLLASTLAAVAVVVVLLRRLGPLREAVTEKHLHDLGSLIYAFSMFWAYIWYCQYMLIWYSNLPEETGYFLLRHSGGWGALSMLNLVINFGVPCVVLMPRAAKRNPSLLLKVSVGLLIGHWLNLCWMVLPPLTGPEPRLSLLWAAGPAAAAAGLAVLALGRGLRGVKA